MDNILGQNKLNKGVIIYKGNFYYTRFYLSHYLNKSLETIKYYVRNEIIPGGEKIPITNGYILAWTQEELKIIRKNVSTISRGRYKKDKHPVKGD